MRKESKPEKVQKYRKKIKISKKAKVFEKSEKYLKMRTYIIKVIVNNTFSNTHEQIFVLNVQNRKKRVIMSEKVGIKFRKIFVTYIFNSKKKTHDRTKYTQYLFNKCPN